MEVQKISDELEGIVESKRIPNALIFEADVQTLNWKCP